MRGASVYKEEEEKWLAKRARQSKKDAKRKPADENEDLTVRITWATNKAPKHTSEDAHFHRFATESKKIMKS